MILTMKRLKQFILVMVMINMLLILFVQENFVYAEELLKLNKITITEFKVERYNYNNGKYEEINDDNKVQGNDKIEINLHYETNGGGISKNDVIKIKLPEELEEVVPDFPDQHFMEEYLENGMILVKGRDNPKALAGKVTIKARVTDVKKITYIPIVIEVNGVAYEKEINIVQQEESEVNMKERGILYKTSNRTYQIIKNNINEIVEEGAIYRPIKDKHTEYEIYVNNEKNSINNVVIEDYMNTSNDLKADSIRIYEEQNSSWKDVTNKFTSINFSQSGFSINLGNINNRYKITYKAYFREEYNDLDSIDNKVTMFSNKAKIANSATRINVYDDVDMLVKYGTTDRYYRDENGKIINQVSKKGTLVPYNLILNQGNSYIENLVVKDIIPNGMKLVTDSVHIYTTGKENDRKWLEKKEVEKIFRENGNVLQFDFGNTDLMYGIVYNLEVVDIYSKYINKAIASYNDISCESESVLEYVLDNSAIDAYKSVNKKFLDESDNKEVTYTIEFNSYGEFDKNYIDLSDTINKNINILDVIVDEEVFDVKIDGNKISIINSKGKIEKGKDYRIIIKTDFSNVEIGEFVQNQAYINGIPTNKVSTQNGIKEKILSQKEKTNKNKVEKDPIKEIVRNKLPYTGGNSVMVKIGFGVLLIIVGSKLLFKK